MATGEFGKRMTTGSPSASAASARPTSYARHFDLVLAATLVVCAYLLVWALGTAPIMGDESHHYRRAEGYWETAWPQFRLTHDPAYPPEGQCAIQYWEAAGWHLGLALIWKLLGRPSFMVAQVYHLGYTFALGIFTYLAARELYGHRGGWWAWALVMTMPLNLLFGTIFYVEVPEAAMVALAVYSILRRRPLWFGAALAGMFYIKLPSATVLAPPLVLAALLRMGDRWRWRAAHTVLAAGVAFLLMLPDMVWRTKHFGSPIIFHVAMVQGPRIAYPLLSQLPPVRQSAIPLYILDPYVSLQNFGVTGLVAIPAAVLASLWLLGRTLRRIGRNLRFAGPVLAVRSLADQVPAEVAVGAIPLIGYIFAYTTMLHMAYDVRYFHPAVFFAALVSGGLLARLRPFAWAGARRRWVLGAAVLLVLAMIGQAVTVPRVVHSVRVLPASTAAGYEWIRRHTPPKARIFYLEYNLTALTKRPIVWAAALPRYVFSVPEAEQIRVFCALDVEYIAIPPTRFIPQLDPTVEPMGYPLPWVRSLPSRPYLKQVFPDPSRPAQEGEFILYQIEKDKVPPEWLKEPPPQP